MPHREGGAYKGKFRLLWVLAFAGTTYCTLSGAATIRIIVENKMAIESKTLEFKILLESLVQDTYQQPELWITHASQEYPQKVSGGKPVIVSGGKPVSDIHEQNCQIQALCSSLERNTKVQSLVFYYYTGENTNYIQGDEYIENETCEVICKLLKANKNIKTLTFDHCAIGNDTMCCIGNIAHSLEKNEIGLKQLILTHNKNIKKLEWKELGFALKTNTTLEELFVNEWDIGAQGVQAFAEGLSNNKTLKRLSLIHAFVICGSMSSMGNQRISIAPLLNGLKRNSSIEYLNLDYNSLNQEEGLALLDLLQVNINICELSNAYSWELCTEIVQDIDICLFFNSNYRLLKAIIENRNEYKNMYFMLTNTKIDKIILENSIYRKQLDELMYQLVAALKKNNKVTSVRFYDYLVGPKILTEMVEVLKENKSVTELFVTTPEQNAETSLMIQNALSKETAIDYLLIATLKSAASPDLKVAKDLNLEKPMTCLSFCNYNLGTEVGSSLEKTLKICKTLTRLEINNCSLGRGAYAIIDALKKNKTLVELELEDPNFDDGVAKELAACVAHHPRLEKLKFRGDLDKGAAQAMVLMSSLNHRILSLDVDYYQIPDNENKSDSEAQVLAPIAVPAYKSIKGTIVKSNINYHIGVNIHWWDLIRHVRENTYSKTELSLNDMFVGSSDFEDSEILSRVERKTLVLALCEALKYSKNIKTLILSKKDDSTEVILKLCEMLKVNQSLEILVLSNDGFGNDEKDKIAAIEEMLKINTNIRLIVDWIVHIYTGKNCGSLTNACHTSLKANHPANKQKQREAVVMGFHPSLGEKSPLKNYLNDHTFDRNVFREVLFLAGMFEGAKLPTLPRASGGPTPEERKDKGSRSAA